MTADGCSITTPATAVSGYRTLVGSVQTPKTRLVSIIQNLGLFPDHLMKKTEPMGLKESNS